MRGRDACFICIYCGRFVSYDMRKTGREYRTEGLWGGYDQIYYPEEVIGFWHKKCKTENQKSIRKEV